MYVIYVCDCPEAQMVCAALSPHVAVWPISCGQWRDAFEVIKIGGENIHTDKRKQHRQFELSKITTRRYNQCQRRHHSLVRLEQLGFGSLNGQSSH